MKKSIKEILNTNIGLICETEKDFKALFSVIFRLEEHVLCESNDGFRIRKETYGQIRRRICETAAALYAKVGASHGYIALDMDNCSDWIVAFWAILMSGNKPYLVNTRYPASLSQGILKTLNVEHIICRESSCLSGTVIPMSQLSGDHPEVPEDVFENEIAFSSSATSMNEVICFYTGQQIVAQVLNVQQIVKENPRITRPYKNNLKHLAFLPFYHVFGLFAVFFWFTFFGCTMVFLRDYSAETILKTCRRHQVTHIFAVPMLWHSIEKQVRSEIARLEPKKKKKVEKALRFCTGLQNIFPNLGAFVAKRLLHQITDKLFGQSVIFCISGGSYLRKSAIELLNGIGYCMHNGYGMSEIGISSVELRRRPKHCNLNSIGHPFSSVEYRLDEEGILQVRGSSLCVRKLINGEPVELGDWFDTGDRMTCKDGHYYIQGRRSDTVIGENGENINPDTVEQHFLIEGAQQLCVLGLPGDGDQELSLVVQLSPYATEAMAERVKKAVYAINDTFPATMAVKQFYFTTDELAPPAAVKVSRKQLEKKIESGEVRLTTFRQFQPEGTQEGELSPMMQQVRRIIAKVLEIEEDTIQSTSHIFYDLGATSIQYFSILSSLAEEFSIANYSSSDKYCYTPKEICEYIEKSLI